jgi:hypothetical protein
MNIPEERYMNPSEIDMGTIKDMSLITIFEKDNKATIYNMGNPFQYWSIVKDASHESNISYDLHMVQ